MHILGSIHFAGPFDIGVCCECISDEILEPFLPFGVTLDGLHDETVRRPA
jgi:hypothetical protein